MNEITISRKRDEFGDTSIEIKSGKKIIERICIHEAPDNGFDMYLAHGDYVPSHFVRRYKI